MGCMRAYPVEKYLRNVISFLHGTVNKHIYYIKMCSRMTGLPANRLCRRKRLFLDSVFGLPTTTF